MIGYLADTNVIVTLLAKRSERLAAHILGLQQGSLGVSSIVAHELYFGAYKSQKVEFNLQTIRQLFTDILVIDFDREDARASGEIRAALMQMGKPIGPYDVLIAGQALARGLPLLTNNTAEFARVPGLRVEDWSI